MTSIHHQYGSRSWPQNVPNMTHMYMLVSAVCGVIAGYFIGRTSVTRDFAGIVDNLPISTRPSTLSAEHNYNLQNQGWTQTSPWTGVVSQPTTFNAVGTSSTFTLSSQTNAVLILLKLIFLNPHCSS
jgi:hypothetical protein